MYNLEQCTFSYLTHQIVTTSVHLDARLNHVCARSARVDSSGRGAGATATVITTAAAGTQTTNGDTRHRWPGDKLYKFKDKIYNYTNTKLLLEHKTPWPKEVPTSDQGLPGWPTLPSFLSLIFCLTCLGLRHGCSRPLGLGLRTRSTTNQPSPPSPSVTEDNFHKNRPSGCQEAHAVRQLAKYQTMKLS